MPRFKKRWVHHRRFEFRLIANNANKAFDAAYRDNNDRITLLEYLLLHYKPMILSEFYKRNGTPSSEQKSTSNGAVGVTGVGFELLDELFTFPATSLYSFIGEGPTSIRELNLERNFITGPIPSKFSTATVSISLNHNKIRGF